MSRNALGFCDDNSDSEPETVLKTKDPRFRSNLTKNNNHLAQSLLFQKVKPLEIDDSTYSYDDHYDLIQESRQAKLRKLNGNSTEEDKLIIQDLRIQRERELEGDEFKGKEEFITGGYKEHKEKLKNLNKEQIKKTNDIKDFHKNIINNELFNKVKKEKVKEELKQINETRQLKPTLKHTTKSRLIPKISEEEINKYKERYFQRRGII